MASERKSLGHDAFWSFAATGTKAVSSALIFFLLANRLGVESYGTYTALLAVFLLAGPFVVFGVMHPLTREVSSNRDAAQSAWGAALAPAFFSSLVFTVIATLLVPLVFNEVSWVAAGALAAAEFMGYALIMTPTFLLNSINKYPVSAAVTVLWSVARLLSVVVSLVILEPSITGASVGFLVAAIVTGVVTSGVVYRIVGRPEFSASKSIQMAKDGFPYSLSSSGSTLLNDVDKLMLYQIKGDEPNGIYSGGNKILSLAAVPMFALLGATYPRFFAAGNENGVAGTSAFAKKLSPIVIVYSILMGAGMFVMAPIIIPILLGDGFEESVRVVRWMVAMPLVNLGGLLAGEILTGAGYQNLRNRMIVIAAVVNISLNAVLIPLYSWGGAIAATYASESTLLLCFVWWARRNIDKPARGLAEADAEPSVAV